jgi:isoleucyl-tRNA synthetase
VPGFDGWRVVPADYVTTEDGTGIVHQSPAFGEIDRQVARTHGLPTFNPVGPDGTFTKDIPWLESQEVRSANSAINDALEAKGRLLKRMAYTHALPHCWRCSTTLIYWGKPSWYLATSTLKDTMLEANEGIDWHPASIQHGRFGDWLANNVDWALSRDRYWGTPLPIWRCDDNHLTCIGSLAELSELSGHDVNNIDPHRPSIDAVTIPCPTCGATASRVAPVIDVWFDSGAMPLAQVGYPHVEGSAEALQYPADYISEAIDQTRGWFYSLLAVNTLLGREAPYRHVMSLGHIVDADGKKMSKSQGNVIDPWEILSTRGADALRWWMFSQGSPWASSRVSFEVIDNALRMTLLTWWNTYSFFMTYASLNGFDPSDARIPLEPDRPALDRWALSRLEATKVAVTAGLEGYEPLGAASAIERLVDDVSNWYVRRSRRRFWRTEAGAPVEDSLSAQATLHTILLELSLLMAPFTPFLADSTYRKLSGATSTDSVHLANWPSEAPGRIDEGLEAQMAVTRRLTSLGRSSRADASVKVRQPLARALVFLAPGSAMPLLDVVAEELNVDTVELASDLASVLRYEIVPNFKTLGPRLGDRVQLLRGAFATLDGAAVAAAVERGESFSVTLGDDTVEIGPGDVELRMKSEGAYAVTRDGAEVVALDLTLTDALKSRGLARDLIRQIQDLRKATGLEVSDRIKVWLVGADDLAEHFSLVASEVLAESLTQGPGSGDASPIDLDGRAAQVWIEKA